MSNIKVTIKGIEKEFEPIPDYHHAEDVICIKKQWYREVEKPKNKNYGILAFRKTTDANVLYRSGFNRFLNSKTGQGYSLEEMLKRVKGGRVEIYKVRRLSDNDVVTVGDVTEFGKIEKIDMEEEEDCIVRYEEVRSIDCRIISFKDVTGQSWVLSKNEHYNNLKYPTSNYNYSLKESLEYVKSGILTIEAVGRLSDDQVFIVGNGMSYKGIPADWGENRKEYCTIQKFALRDGKIYINEHNNGFTIEDWVLYNEPPVILIAEDGVEITDGEKFLYALTDNFKCHGLYAKTLLPNPSGKFFSTEEARDNYILENKPITVTLKELQSVIDGYDDMLQYNFAPFFKSKQNNQ